MQHTDWHGGALRPAHPMEDEMNTFRAELEALLNRYSREMGSNTPDFLLAEFLLRCLDAFDAAVRDRQAWYGKPMPEPSVSVDEKGHKQTGPFPLTVPNFAGEPGRARRGTVGRERSVVDKCLKRLRAPIGATSRNA